jgi:hypothetical protein
MSRFYEIEPTSENYWRAIILFGRNSASYKFALAKALLEFILQKKNTITLEELAVPYSSHLCEHLKKHPKQNTSKGSSFLTKLRSFNERNINQDEMIQQTVRLGFNNVLDAFHNVHGNEVNVRFFLNESKSNNRIRLTDDFFRMAERAQFENLNKETESRWRLVESAWENNLNRNLMLVEYEEYNKNLIGVNSLKRTTLTSARPALNGYQKGRCFYCFCEISIIQGSERMADVDHFFPHILRQCDNNKPINSVTNLVLACKECNRGENGKFEKLPTIDLLERLYNRNEYLISSHHPLRGTLMAQTGITTANRQNYLQKAYNCSITYLGSRGSKWQPESHGDAIF